MKHLEAIVSGFAQFGLECIGNLAFIFGGRYHTQRSLRHGLYCLRLTKSHFGGANSKNRTTWQCVYVCICVCIYIYIYIYLVSRLLFIFSWDDSFKRRYSFWCKTRFLQLETMSEIPIIKFQDSWPLVPWFLVAVLCLILSCVLGTFGSFPRVFVCKNLWQVLEGSSVYGRMIWEIKCSIGAELLK